MSVKSFLLNFLFYLIIVMKELVIKVDGQKAITKDNVTVDLDGVLYIKVRMNGFLLRFENNL